MKKRFLYGAGIVLLVVSATLVIWQGSFTFGEFGPTSPEQTFLYWAVSTLVFRSTRARRRRGTLSWTPISN
jgi:two-component system nitrogen regulation sensor histidine kinase NtrY